MYSMFFFYMADVVLSQEPYICRAAKRCRSAESHLVSGVVKAGGLW
jgi:hypothetical protein